VTARRRSRPPRLNQAGPARPFSGYRPWQRRSAPSRRAVYRWLARLMAGEAGVVLMTEIRGASNARVRREFGWTLRYPTWRRGFVEVYQS
jgi:hypothetical protein